MNMKDRPLPGEVRPIQPWDWVTLRCDSTLQIDSLDPGEVGVLRYVSLLGLATVQWPSRPKAMERWSMIPLHHLLGVYRDQAG